MSPNGELGLADIRYLIRCFFISLLGTTPFRVFQGQPHVSFHPVSMLTYSAMRVIGHSLVTSSIVISIFFIFSYLLIFSMSFCLLSSSQFSIGYFHNHAQCIISTVMVGHRISRNLVTLTGKKGNSHCTR